MQDRGIWSDGIPPKVYELEEFQRKTVCGYALDALCTHGTIDDLPLARQVIDDMKVDCTLPILKFLASYGNWSDVGRVINLGEHFNPDTGLFNVYFAKMPVHKAATILALGKNRLTDVLELKLEHSLQAAIACALTKKSIAEFSDEVLLRELKRQNDNYRIIFALRCISSLPKARVTSLLSQYIDETGQRYYNVAHWLDLAASFPQQTARAIADAELKRYA